MSTTEHTPGPWYFHGFQIAAGARADYELVAYTPGDRSFPPHERANGRLIAAAPDLLAACERIADMMEPGYRTGNPEWDAVRDVVTAAIAKARGEADAAQNKGGGS